MTTGLSDRQAAKRAQIATAARKLFLELGFAGSSMDAISAEAGVSKQTLYTYFPAKVDLVRAIRRACAAYEQRGAPDVAAWQSRANPGQRVRQVADGREGRITGVASDGALLVQWDGGAGPERFVAGELEHLPGEVGA